MYDFSYILYELKFGNICKSVSILLCLQLVPIEDTGHRKPDFEQSRAISFYEKSLSILI
jgi:hypothetical protein